LLLFIWSWFIIFLTAEWNSYSDWWSLRQRDTGRQGVAQGCVSLFGCFCYPITSFFCCLLSHFQILLQRTKALFRFFKEQQRQSLQFYFVLKF
jgi:hypothetical protein